ncbi:MAG: hypothetical protein NT120_03915 [Candidatus Aenigmarchaeota archaeon]|nr:hypothetical protein [Candidatus Aenigmarchaeota archaeon]
MIIDLSVGLTDFDESRPLHIQFDPTSGFDALYYSKISGHYSSLIEMRARNVFPGCYLITGNEEQGYRLEKEISFNKHRPLALVIPM